MTIGQAKIKAKAFLSGNNSFGYVSPSPDLDIDCILLWLLNKNKTWLLMNRDFPLDQLEEQFFEAIEKRTKGLPVAYITGHKEFYGYDFMVSPSVLIPKPDTEILVEKAIDTIIGKMEARPQIVLSVCDMCTGSGCVGLSVLRTLIDEYKIPAGDLPKFTFVDISMDALKVAKQNASRLLSEDELELVRFIQSDLFYDVPYTFDVILTNPPYVPGKMVDELLKDGRNEPRLALDGDVQEGGIQSGSTDGLDLIRRLWPGCYERLIFNGVVLMETGEYNAKESAKIARESGFRMTRIFEDLEGQLRVTEAIK